MIAHAHLESRSRAERMPPLLVRADASTQMGTGHVMRCLALAQAWQEAGGRAQFALALSTPAAEARLSAEGMQVARVSAGNVDLRAAFPFGGRPGSAEDAGETVAMAREIGAAWVVVDGYHFDAAYQRSVKGAGLQLLAVDDYGHASHYSADLVLNQNIYAAESLYPSREATTRLLLGTRYALLRSEFWPWRAWQRTVPEVARKVLVTMGGADADNATLKVVEALRQVEGLGQGLEVKVVVGGSNPHREALRETLTVGVELIENAPNMPELMAWSDAAVSAAGTTCWELAFMQVPSLLVVLAENQRPNAAGLQEAGVAVNMGWHGELASAELARALTRLLGTREQQVAMAQEGRRLVDGEGARRVAGLLAEATVRVRRVAPQDRELLFLWANDPLTRQMSLRSEAIEWEEHRHWFDQVVSCPGVFLVIAEGWTGERWAPLGQVRIDRAGVVSIALAAEHRGHGLARRVLQAGIAMHRSRTPSEALTAYIKPENEASLRIFAQAGFTPMGWAEVLGQWLLKYIRACG